MSPTSKTNVEHTEDLNADIVGGRGAGIPSSMSGSGSFFKKDSIRTTLENRIRTLVETTERSINLVELDVLLFLDEKYHREASFYEATITSLNTGLGSYSMTVGALSK